MYGDNKGLSILVGFILGSVFASIVWVSIFANHIPTKQLLDNNVAFYDSKTGKLMIKKLKD